MRTPMYRNDFIPITILGAWPMEMRRDPIKTIIGTFTSDFSLAWRFPKIRPLEIDARKAMRTIHW